jgi:hypothetical protein
VPSNHVWHPGLGDVERAYGDGGPPAMPHRVLHSLLLNPKHGPRMRNALEERPGAHRRGRSGHRLILSLIEQVKPFPREVRDPVVSKLKRRPSGNSADA